VKHNDGRKGSVGLKSGGIKAIEGVELKRKLDEMEWCNSHMQTHRKAEIFFPIIKPKLTAGLMLAPEMPTKEYTSTRIEAPKAHAASVTVSASPFRNKIVLTVM
jgi:hypothetical protein